MIASAKIVGFAVVAGLIGTCLVGMALRRPPAPGATDELPVMTPKVDRLRLAHCRTLAAPDADCAAAWEAERRRFFRDDRR
ncbi:putative entry exclusion protein TrbK-alt [Sphingomonas sp. MMSM20]|uniref:putative entry exclusion protein TrbK-alt n=1 Tax=Sphingomonas lycopersici TaxID=2951807 RepID=UPI002237E741|nr:putative entry exclusion protein TrbK-alt [Sphingomonas lycopersici]MCW6530730.1 putative entry exclusion protein TrbK-alt [Sphingomonas lycopersici]